MKVAVVNSFYRSEFPSGENVAVRQEIRALQKAGVDVVEVFRHTDNLLPKPLYKPRSAIQVASGLDFDSPLGFLSKNNVDLIHVHNTFPNFGTRWLGKTSIPVVATVHNYRFACANGLFYREGHVCTNCFDSGSSASFVHSCYQDSKLATLPLTVATARGALGNRVFHAAEAVITQTLKMYSFLMDSGISQEKLHYIPGFVEQRHSGASDACENPRFLYVGRNSPEKGLEELLAIWPPRYTLDVIGASATDIQIAETASTEVNFLGVKPREFITSTIQNYTALIFPGRAWEGALPLVVREAFEAGVPVLALEGSSASQLVNELGAGLSYSENSPSNIQSQLKSLIDHNHEFRLRSRKAYESECTELVWSNRVLAVYEALLSRSQ